MCLSLNDMRCILFLELVRFITYSTLMAKFNEFPRHFRLLSQLYIFFQIFFLIFFFSHIMYEFFYPKAWANVYVWVYFSTVKNIGGYVCVIIKQRINSMETPRILNYSFQAAVSLFLFFSLYIPTKEGNMSLLVREERFIVGRFRQSPTLFLAPFTHIYNTEKGFKVNSI